MCVCILQLLSLTYWYRDAHMVLSVLSNCQMYVDRAGNGASHREQCVNSDLEGHCKYNIVYLFVQGILLWQNSSYNEKVTFILFVLR